MIAPSFPITATERVLPRMALDFTTGVLDPRVTVTRALNTATRVNSSGSIESVNANLPRFDYDPATLAPKGLLIEEARTNSIRNSTSQGAVAGTPGTAPTNWSVTSTGFGLTREIVGVGKENGVDYVDVRFYGTPTGGILIQFLLEANNQIAASNGQTWASSVFLKLVAGSMTNVSSLALSTSGRDALGNSVAGQTFTSSAITPTNASLITQRNVLVNTFSNALVAFIRPSFQFLTTINLPIDITLRVGLPQTELGAFATSPIPTTTTSLTRNADVVSMTGANFSDWYNASEGTFVVQADTSAASAAALNASDGTTANRLTLQLDNGFQGAVLTGDVVQASLDSGTLSAGINAITLAYKQNSFALSLNGASVVTDTSGTLPTVNKLVVGANGAGTASFLNGCVSKIMYWTQRVTNQEAQAFAKG